MSKSASPLPKTILPGCRRPESSSPWKVGVAPNGPVQKCVPKKLGLNSHCSPVTATVPSLATATAGSLSPSGRINGVLEKLRLPDTVPAKADAPARITTSKALRINPPLSWGVWNEFLGRAECGNWLSEGPQPRSSMRVSILQAEQRCQAAKSCNIHLVKPRIAHWARLPAPVHP